MQNKVLRHGNQWYAIECVRLCTWKLRLLVNGWDRIQCWHATVVCRLHTNQHQ
jgi:hypothetical protein